MLLVWFLQRLHREGELDIYLSLYIYISLSLSIYLLQVSRGHEDKHDPNRDDTGKKIYVPWKKNSRSLEKIFTAPGKEI